MFTQWILLVHASEKMVYMHACSFSSASKQFGCALELQVAEYFLFKSTWDDVNYVALTTLWIHPDPVDPTALLLIVSTWSILYLRLV